MLAKSQNIESFSKEDIVGRWMEAKRIEGDTVRMIAEHPDTYIFRDNMVFHKGEAADGIIVFNITGRYTIEGNLIEVQYRDYLKKDAGKQEIKKLIFEIKSLNKNKTEMLILIRDYDYEYEIVLTR